MGKRQLGALWALLGIYIGIAPVYWISGVPTAAMEISKITLLFGVLVLVLTIACLRPDGTKVPRVLIIAGGLIACSAMPSLLNNPSGAPRFFADWIPPLGLVCGVFVAVRSTGQRLEPRAVKVGGTIILILATSHLVLIALGFNWYNPYFPGREITDFEHAAFGSRRTGWSNALAILLPSAIFTARSVSTNDSIRAVLGLMAVGVICGSQLLVGGRAGLLASGGALAAYGIGSNAGKRGIVFLALFSTLLITAAFAPEHLRLDRLSDVGTFDAWNNFSAGRLAEWTYSYEIFTGNWLTGSGFGVMEWGERGVRGHMLYLQAAVQGGLLFGVTVALFAGLLGYRALVTAIAARKRTLDEERRDLLMACAATLIAGLIISLFTHSLPVGNFHLAPIWWVALGILLGNGAKSQKRQVIFCNA